MSQNVKSMLEFMKDEAKSQMEREERRLRADDKREENDRILLHLMMQGRALPAPPHEQ